MNPSNLSDSSEIFSESEEAEVPVGVSEFMEEELRRLQDASQSLESGCPNFKTGADSAKLNAIKGNLKLSKNSTNTNFNPG